MTRLVRWFARDLDVPPPDLQRAIPAGLCLFGVLACVVVAALVTL